MKKAHVLLGCAAFWQVVFLAFIVIVFFLYITDFPLPGFYPSILAVASVQLGGFFLCLCFLLPAWRTSLEDYEKIRYVSAYVFGFLALLGVLFAIGAGLYANWPEIHEQEDLHYARVGSVSDSTARLWVREGESPPNDELSIWWRAAAAANESWQVVTSPTSKFADWTAVFVLGGLSSSTTYEWTTKNPDAADFDGPILQFQTFPEPTALVPFSFAFGSCIIETASLGYEHLPEIENREPDFLIFLGDLIYADVPWLFGTDLYDYYKSYRWLWSAENARVLFDQIPNFIMYDDHEVDNDWTIDTVDDKQLENALTAWQNYVGQLNPQTFGAAGLQPNYFTFQYGSGADFFVTDSRLYRTDNQFLGEEQWLASSDAVFKFIASSVSYTFPSLTDGTWTDTALTGLMTIIQQTGATGVVLLSGDLHLGIAAPVNHKLAPPGLYEFTASPWGAFNFPGKDEPDDAFFFANREELSASVVVDPTTTEPSFSVTFYGNENAVLFNQTYALRNNIITPVTAGGWRLQAPVCIYALGVVLMCLLHPMHH